MPDETVKIIHVDDDPYIREMAAALLTREGYQVDSAKDGQQAVDMLAANDRYGLVITDWDMPRVNGGELLRILRQRKFPGRIIVFSGSLTNDDKVTCLNLGVDMTLTKGTALVALGTAVQRVMGNSGDRKCA